MTTKGDEEQLAINVIAKLNDLETQMAKASGITAKAFREMSLTTKRATRQMEQDAARSAERINAALATVGTRIGDVGRNFLASTGGTLATALSASTVVKYADEWKRAGNTLAGAGVELGKVAATQQVVADIASRSRSDIGSTTELYARLTRSSKDLGATQAQISVATETVAKGLKLSGATAGEASGAMLQLSQALQSGKLGGDELRSLLEGAPIIAQAVAKEFGVAVGQLKQLGTEGKLTADRVFKAIVDSADDVEAAFAKTTPTVEDSFKSLETAAIRFVGTSSSVQAATGAISSGLQKMAGNVDVVATGATALGAIIAARLIGAGLSPLVSGFGRGIAASASMAGSMNLLNLALVATVAQANAASIAAAGLSRVLAFVGGPVGLAVLGIGAAMLYAGQQSAMAEARARTYADALAEVQAKAKASAGAIDTHTDAVVRAAQAQAAEQTNTLGKGIAETENDIRRFTAQIGQLLAGYAAVSRKISDPADVQALRDLAKGFDGTTESAGKTKDRLFELANANPNFQEIADRLKPLIDGLLGARALADSLQAKLAAVPKAVAEADSRALDRKITSGVPQVSYEAATAPAMSDPLLGALKSQGMLQREVAHAEMEKTARAVEDEKKRIVDQIREAGGTVDMKAVDLAAKRIVAAKERDKARTGSDSEDEYERMGRRIEEHIAMLDAEAAAIGKTDRERDKARTTQQLLTAAQQADVQVTTEVRAAIDALSDRYANAADHARKLEKAQHDAVEAADGFRSATKDVLTGFISDLRQGKSGAEALANALNKIETKIIDRLVGDLVDGLLGKQGTSAGGLFKGLLGLFGFADGGAFGAGGVQAFAKGGAFTDSIVASPTLFKFANGTGLMGEAGPEAIMPLRRDRNGRLGVAAAGGSAPVSSTSNSYSPTVNMQMAGSSGDPARDHQHADQMKRELKSVLDAHAAEFLRMQMRGGGMLRGLEV